MLDVQGDRPGGVIVVASRLEACAVQKNQVVKESDRLFTLPFGMIG